ncbi:MAG TPA: phage major capsid protein [Candidatus Binatus sp.]|nr:phage major capsid protein [Candidatus Binatus sp.]
MATRLELQRKRAALIEKAEKIVAAGESEKRDLTTAEKTDFDAFLRQADELRSLIEGGKPRSQTLAEHRADLQRREGRRVAPDQISGPNFSRPGTAMRFLTDDGREIRGLEPDEPFASASIRQDALPDGIQAEELSIGRWIRAQITGDWSKARAEQRAMGAFSDVTGGVTVPLALAGNFIDLARPKTTVIKAGATIFPMDSAQLRIAKLLQDVQPAWKGENAIGTTSDAQFGGVTLTPRTLIGLAITSQELAQDSTNFEDMIEHSLTEALALEVDRAALLGDGTNGSPTGIFNTPGVNSVSLGTNGGAVGYGNFSTAMKLILKANGIPRTAIFSTRTWSELDSLLNTLGDALRPPPSWDELDKMVTSQIPENQTQGSASTCSCAFVGDFNQLILGMRADLRIDLSPYAGDAALNTFRAYQIAIRAVLRADVQLTRPPHFSVISGIL